MSLTVAGRRRLLEGTAMRVLLTILITAALTLSTGVLSASAHAILVASTPEDGEVFNGDPENAELQFNEPVKLIDGAIRLFPSDGDPIILDAQTRDRSVVISLPEALTDGTYALSYRIVSADGHPVGGAITFHIGDASSLAPAPGMIEDGTPPASESAVTVLTALQYLGLLVFTGLVFFHRVILRDQRLCMKARRFMQTALGCGVAASLLLIPASALRVAGESLASAFSPDRWLPGLQWPPILVAFLALVSGLASYHLVARTHRSAAHVPSVILAATATATPVLVGHSQTTEPAWLIIAADLTHLIVGAFWAGGVIGLFLFLRSVNARHGDTPTDVIQATQVTRRFSQFALYSVLLLALSGAVMTALILNAPPQLINTGYGRTLLLKLCIVAAIIALAAWNRTRLLPRIVAHPSPNLRWLTLKRTLSYEAALIITVIVITGYLGNSSPNHTHHHDSSPVQNATPQETPVRIDSQGLLVSGSLHPTTTGSNTLAFSLVYDGQPVTSDEVQVSARLPEQNLGPITTAATLDRSTGEYESSLTLPVSGEWQFEISARVSTYDQPIAIQTITIP